MAFFDYPLEDLQVYLPLRVEPPDFDRFWQETLEATRQYPLQARFEPMDAGIKTLDIFDVTFNGYKGQQVKAWMLLPRGWVEPLPCVLEFIGYGGGRGFPSDWLFWPSMGFASLVMDTRGQGSAWRQGDTPDYPEEGTNPHFGGFMTQGILSPETYYYRRLFSDAVRLVETALEHPAVDSHRLAVTGGSQGGGISLAVAGLEPRLQALLADVPFLCHYRRAVQITDAAPYSEIVNYCQVHRDKLDTVFHTLSYFDGLNFAVRSHAAALFSVGLMDEVCPPSTVFAAYNHYAGSKDIRIYTYNHHEGGESYQALEKISFLRNLWSLG